MDGRAWLATVQGVAKNHTQLNEQTTTNNSITLYHVIKNILKRIFLILQDKTF